MLFKTIAVIGLFAAGGAAIGYSKILCMGGECAITGTPYGGALFGGVIGLAVMSGLNNAGFPARPDNSTDDSEESEVGQDEPEHK